MNRSTIKGFAFIISNIITIVAVFLPYYIIIFDGKEISRTTLMPTVMGIVVILVSIVSCGMVFAGLQQKCGFAAAASVVSVIITIVRMTASKQVLIKGALISSKGFLSILDGDSDITGGSAELGIGFYLLLLGAIASVVTGILFATERD